MNRTQRAKAWLQVKTPLLAGFLRQLMGYDNQIVSLEYRVDVKKPRYGYSHPKLQAIDALCVAKRGDISGRAKMLAKYVPDLSTIPLASAAPALPYWENGWFPALDAISLYGLLRELKPTTYLEVGSGHSTRFARRAITDGNLGTKIISIDPHPRADVSPLSDTIVQSRLEDTDLDVFNIIEPGDFVFFDGSHRSFVNTDVTVLFLEVLPKLPRGTIVFVHDIYLPYDYPVGIPFYNEQYLLAAYLLAGNELEVLFPCAYVTRDADLRRPIEEAVKTSLVPGVELTGCGFWMRKA